jgi:hypothetical protein
VNSCWVHFCQSVTYRTVLLLLFILTAKGPLAGGSCITTRHNPQIPHITQNNTNKTLKDTLRTMNTIHIQLIKNRTNDHRLSTKLERTFADRAFRIVSATDPPRPHSRFYRPEPLLFLTSSSTVVIARLSEPRSRPTTSQKSGSAGNRNQTSGSVARNWPLDNRGGRILYTKQ